MATDAIAGHLGPMVIIAGRGMATGGRVLHHPSRYAPDARNAIARVGRRPLHCATVTHGCR